MLSWIKGLFKNPKSFIKLAVDSLDFAVPFMASEIEKIEAKFNQMNSSQKAQVVVDKIQDYLRKQWKLNDA